MNAKWCAVAERARVQSCTERAPAVAIPSNIVLCRNREGIEKVLMFVTPTMQAYVDESTKQVYYGNSLTSETSWERPTK